MGKKMRISFDFDSCLSEKIMQNIAKSFVLSDNEVFIVTSRSNKIVTENLDLFIIAKSLGIKVENIYFTNGNYKWAMLKELKIDLHYDDMEDEVYLVNVNGGCAVLFNFDIENSNYLFNNVQTGKVDKFQKVIK